MIVSTWRGRQGASDELYWHVVPSAGQWAEMFFNKVRVGKGELSSVSVFNEVYGGTAEAQSGYGMKSRGDDKEQEFERVRRDHFPDKPSRIDALFLFDEPQCAEDAAAHWFADEKRLIVEARLLSGALVHRGDAGWLDLAEVQGHDSCAPAYWRGELTPQPSPEIIVHGRAFFPQWKEFPTEADVKAGKLRTLVEEMERKLRGYEKTPDGEQLNGHATRTTQII